MASELHLVTFHVGPELFGVPISAVQEIVRVPVITRVPRAPSFVEGIINLRGRVIPVIDMRRRLDRLHVGADSSEDRRRRILVVETGGRLFGIIVSEVSEVLKLAEESVEAAPPMVAGLSNQYIRGVGKLEDALLILMDIEKVLTAEEVEGLDGVSPGRQLPEAA